MPRRKKMIFERFYGQRSVTAAWATRSPLSICIKYDVQAALLGSVNANAKYDHDDKGNGKTL